MDYHLPVGAVHEHAYMYVCVCGGEGRGHYIGNCTPTPHCGQSEQAVVAKINFGAGRVVKVGNQWVWLMLDSQGSTPDFQCGQGVKHVMGQDLDCSHGGKYRRLCSAPLLMYSVLFSRVRTTPEGKWEGIE